MRAGRLRHRVTLQSKGYAANEYGERVVSWVSRKVVWAAIEPLSGKEYFSQQQIQAEARVRIVMRYYSSIDESWRILNDGKYYEVVDVINHDERDRMMTVYCRQGVSDDVGDVSGMLLMESGSSLLLENGGTILQE